MSVFRRHFHWWRLTGRDELPLVWGLGAAYYYRCRCGEERVMYA